MDFTGAVKMFCTNVVWLVGELWIGFCILLKGTTTNHHETCTKLHHFDRLVNWDLTLIALWIEHIVTNKAIEDLRILISNTLVNGLLS